ncbi:MAG TPA: xanthine dehydrogenase family protein subunit M [Methylomirabilota bacterium]|nr:xanthine dehydrogenase family protein subunit M [Methylomirabilota bacterium]
MYVPENLNELLSYLNDHRSGVQLIANGSDLINRMQRRQVEARVLVDLSGLSEFNYVRNDNGKIRIGALTTIQELVSSPVLREHYEVFRDIASKFGGPAIVNVATVGGNICAASSSEDLIPALLVLDAKVRVVSKQGERVIDLEHFLIGKRQTAIHPNEILVETMFNELDDQSACAFEKIGMRNSLIIAFLNCSVFLKLAKESRRIEEVKIAMNRVAGKIPSRAKKTEAELRGNTLTKGNAENAVRALLSELRLTSDFRASEKYRREVAPVMFKRTLIKCLERLGETPLV